jgi:hypothetical protein
MVIVLLKVRYFRESVLPVAESRTLILSLVSSVTV